MKRNEASTVTGAQAVAQPNNVFAYIMAKSNENKEAGKVRK